MLNLMIVKKSEFLSFKKRAEEAETRCAGLEVKQGKSDDEVIRLTAENKKLAEDLAKEKARFQKYIEKLTEARKSALQKWWHGYPGETYTPGSEKK